MALNQIAHVDMTMHSCKCVNRLQALFQGLGNLGEPYNIQTKPEGKPHALFMPCQTPLPLHQQVKAELDEMETEEIVSQVDVPTP